MQPGRGALTVGGYNHWSKRYRLGRLLSLAFLTDRRANDGYCHRPVRREVEVGIQRVGDAPDQHLTGEPVHDGHQIQEAFAHRQICDVGAPDLIGPINAQPAQQIGVGLVALGGLAGVGLW